VKSATIYDVARVAGVSHQTVSRFLSGFEGIRPSTRARVEAALAELDYKPNAAARLLRTQRINRIGVLAHSIQEAGPSRTLAGAAAAARRHGYVLDIVAMDGDDPASVDAAIAIALEHQVAGLIATAQTDAVQEMLARQAISVPIVTEVTVTPPGFDMSHDESIGALAVDHLLGLGHTAIAYMAGPSTWAAAEGRLRGLRRRLADRGVSLAWLGHGDWSAASGYRAAQELLASGVEVTAIAAANDSTAIGVIAALAERGIRIPEDISVLGTDDIPDARFHLPSLSTVAIDFEGEGSRLVEVMLTQAGLLDADERSELRAPAVVHRGSTAAR
jgi:DNA-binding LacI/PurR family transcriptional regulator